LTVCRIFLLQRKPTLGRTKPSPGAHAARGPRVGHGWSSWTYQKSYLWSDFVKVV